MPNARAAMPDKLVPFSITITYLLIIPSIPLHKRKVSRRRRHYRHRKSFVFQRVDIVHKADSVFANSFGLCVFHYHKLPSSFHSGYDRYSFGIGIGRYISIGRYIGFADMENVLSVSLSVSADTDFYIGFLPIW